MTASDSTRPAANETPSRRTFLQSSTAAVVGGALASTWLAPRAVHAGVDETIRIGLIGCGGRGTGAANQALNADANVRLVAMGDTFPDRLEQSRAELTRLFGDRADVPADRRFVGFDAYRQVIASDVDVVLLCTPPHFRPAHFEAAVQAGKHVFAEKPVAVDAPGVRRVLAAAEIAKQKKLAVVSGLCWRYHQPKREVFQRIHDGAIGAIVAMQVSYNTGGLWNKGRDPKWSDMEWQMRNWLYFTWLSGDHNVEQHVHSLDKACWAMHDEPPVRATGLGGRQVRTSPEYGHIFDHHAVVYEYANGVRLFSFCRQQDNCSSEVADYIMGTKGTAFPMEDKIKGETDYKFRGDAVDMYQQEHNELFASIRAGKPIDNSLYMARSTMVAIMGRMATYTGQTVSWDQAMASQEDLSPKAYEWSSMNVAAVARPGFTPLV